MAIKVPWIAFFALLLIYAAISTFISISSLEAGLLRHSDSAAFLRSFVANSSAPRDDFGDEDTVASVLADAATVHLPPNSRRPVTKRRFPLHGTAEFASVCNYTERAYSVSGCAFYARPWWVVNEGVSAWASNVASMFLYAAQSRCRLLVDYGPNVSVEEVLMPPPLPPSAASLTGYADTAANGQAPKVANWTVPRGFECRYEDQCVDASEGKMVKDLQRTAIERILFIGRDGARRPLVVVPKYRFAYNGGSDVLRRDDFANLADALPGFEIETGMACAWNRLFQLAPTAAKFRPDLFTKILPAVHDDEAFVITLYIRSKHAGRTAKTEFGDVPQKIVKCAARLEEEYLTTRGGGDSGGGLAYIRSVWLVVTDSPNIGRHIASTYDTTAANQMGNVSNILPRHVLWTKSRGIHSQLINQPDTSIFADALIDWYLIGESDVVVSQGSFSFGSRAVLRTSFGFTGALRTARPVYDTGCSHLTLVQEGEGP